MHTVIIGGGFAGIKTALELSRHQLGRITLISDRPYFLHRNTLYAAAVGHDPASTAVALDDIFAGYPDIQVVQATLTSIDPDRKLAVCGNRSYHYDTLVLALGTQVNHTGVQRRVRQSFDLASLEHVAALHDHLAQALTRDQPVDRNYVIIGGGATGVELAGALSSYARQLSARHTPRRAKIRVTLAHAHDRLLETASHSASRQIMRRLRRLGVAVLTNTRVSTHDSDYVTIGTRKIPTDAVIWTDGTRAHPFFAEHPQYFDTHSDGTVRVNPYLEAYRDVYVVGDGSDVRGSGRVRAALDMAVYLADHLARRQAGRFSVAYHPSSTLLNIPVGPGWAYVECLGVYIAGRTGNALSRRLTRDSYRSIMPRELADTAIYQLTRKKLDL